MKNYKIVLTIASGLLACCLLVQKGSGTSALNLPPLTADQQIQILIQENVKLTAQLSQLQSQFSHFIDQTNNERLADRLRIGVLEKNNVTQTTRSVQIATSLSSLEDRFKTHTHTYDRHRITWNNVNIDGVTASYVYVSTYDATVTAPPQ